MIDGVHIQKCICVFSLVSTLTKLMCCISFSQNYLLAQVILREGRSTSYYFKAKTHASRCQSNATK